MVKRAGVQGPSRAGAGAFRQWETRWRAGQSTQAKKAKKGAFCVRGMQLSIILGRLA